MLTTRLHLRTASARGGFTLVELLVVIGIIAILAGVALGPITSGIRRAQQNAGMQQSRTIYVALFSYANDNNSNFPDGADAGAIANTLYVGKYVSDPKTFQLSGDSTYVTPTGTTTLKAANCSFDFAGTSTGATTGIGVGPSASDLLPVVWSGGDSGAAIPTGAGAGTAFAPTTGIYSTYGIAVGYKSGSAFFRSVQTTAAPTFPGQGNVDFVDQAFDPAGVTYAIRVGSTGK